MNAALKKEGDGKYYLVGAMRTDRGICVRGRYVCPNGDEKTGVVAFVGTEAEAKRKISRIVRIKIRKRGYLRVPLSLLPEKVAVFLELPLESRMTYSEMVTEIREARRERYVVFENVWGMEKFFDRDVEYLALVVDCGHMAVYDRFGETRIVAVSRLRHIRLTEKTIEAQRVHGDI